MLSVSDEQLASERWPSEDVDELLESLESNLEDRDRSPSRRSPLERRETIARFEVVAHRGEGGYGTVFEVRDPELDRHVALKLCLTSGPRAAAALMKEAKLLAQLSHPNIITVHELGRDGDEVFFVMELMEGETVHDFTRRYPRPSCEAIVDVYRGAGRGLEAAHGAGIVHGDFKPSNILLDSEDHARVSDFGLARAMPHDGPEPEPGSPKSQPGTTRYMAPEVHDGQPAGPQADLFSFCVSLWESLEGLPPFEGESRGELREAMVTSEPETGLDVPEPLRAIVRRGLSPDPRERYASMGELLAELDEWRAGLAVWDPRLERAVALKLQAMADERMFVVAELDSRPSDNDGASPGAAMVVPEPGAGLDDTATLTLSSRMRSAGITGIGVALMVLVTIGGLLVLLYRVRGEGRIEDQEQPAMRSEPTPVERGEQKIVAAAEILSVDPLTTRELDVVVKLWWEGAGLIRLSDKRRAAQLTLELAADIHERAGNTKHAGALAVQAAQWRESLNEWTLAVEAQKQAVKYYETADASELLWARGCLASLKVNAPCAWPSSPRD